MRARGDWRELDHCASVGDEGAGEEATQSVQFRMRHFGSAGDPPTRISVQEEERKRTAAAGAERRAVRQPFAPADTEAGEAGIRE